MEKDLFRKMVQGESPDPDKITSGSCALVALLLKKTLYVANAGDCEALLIKDNGEVTTLNSRHNIAEPAEQERMKRLFPGEKDLVVYPPGGGCYLKGRLQPTYSFGDFYLKLPELNLTGIKQFTGPYVEHLPEIRSFEIE